MDGATRAILEKALISPNLTEHILKASQGGRYNPPPLEVRDLPPVNGRDIIDFTSRSERVLALEIDGCLSRLEGLGLTSDQGKQLLARCGIDTDGRGPGSPVVFGHAQLKRLGMYFLPLVSFGLLNGGSASSYFDQKKNREFSPMLFGHLHDLIETYSQAWASRPKGISPAFLVPGAATQPDFSFMELKLRGWLLMLRDYRRLCRSLGFTLPWDGLEGVHPVFQMVNQALAGEVASALDGYRASPLLRDLITETGIDITDCTTGVQDMVAAFTHPGPDGDRGIFLEAWGKKNSPLAMPGGHGQNFKVLDPVYRALAASGKRLAYLGNIDNLGYLPDPAAVAMMLLTDRPAAFEFSYKTSMDRKGGVLVSTVSGRLTSGDIGQAVSQNLINETEARQAPILFNCATGLFSLDYLVPRLEEIQRDLPIRFTNQDKDAGKYSQAEQTTWEIIGLIEAPLILAVSKQERFLAAKFFLDCLLTSGYAHGMTGDNDADRELLAIGRTLNAGLEQLLAEKYGLEKKGSGWVPIA